MGICPAPPLDRSLEMASSGRTCSNCQEITYGSARVCAACGQDLSDARPLTPDVATDARPPPAAAPYRSADRRVLWAQLALGLMVLVILIDMWARLREIELLGRVRNGRLITLVEAEASDGRVALSGLLWFAAYVVAAVMFLVWIHAAHRKVGSLGAAGLRFTPRSAVGWWFVPFANLGRPYQVTAEIWKASDPDHARTDTAWQRAGVSPLVKLWWAVWILSAWVGPGIGTLFREPSLSQLILDGQRDVAASAVLIVAAGLAVLLIRRIAARRRNEPACCRCSRKLTNERGRHRTWTTDPGADHDEVARSTHPGGLTALRERSPPG